MSREQRQPGQGQAGFTLIEFLIAATLLALMGAAVFGSLRVALNSYTRSQELMQEDGRQRVLEDMVRRQLGSLYPLAPSLRLSTGKANPMQVQMPGLTQGGSSCGSESSAGQCSSFLWEFFGFDLRYGGAV